MWVRPLWFSALHYYCPDVFCLQFGMDQFHIGLMFIIVAGIYLFLALIIGRLSDKFVSIPTAQDGSL